MAAIHSQDTGCYELFAGLEFEISNADSVHTGYIYRIATPKTNHGYWLFNKKDYFCHYSFYQM